ncbi:MULTISPECIES: multinuclear nonheme iron-dependent oxidase [Clostridium]|uniref:multinuclear nonheme iron-dependent oxidase n=1 Tax=Clostridium TaxID=1485 RepID=UPI00069FF95E|nr:MULTISPECIES: DUF692 family multinuclear iron-containing protein [Clostridium]KOF55645.1 hypothetical protein AGR56_17430 [Clostridium sp. DMHC 10]MCD2347619.1 DUF692 family protein [Clostridium guangxiense]
MYIGCNWSKELRMLLEKNAVKVDYVKSGAFGNFDKEFETMRSMRPVLLHGLGYFENTGMKNIEVIDFNRANNLIEKCNSFHYGVHLAIRNIDMGKGMSDVAIYEHLSKNIKIFKDNLNVPLLIENSPDTTIERKKYDFYPYFTPQRISELSVNNDVYFLLDIAHAKITAKDHGLDVYDYIKKLPLDRIKEIHLAGSGYNKDGFPIDTHQAMKDEDYKLLDWVLNYSKPDVVTLEYNGISGENEELITKNLEEQLNKINRICRN